MTRDVELSVQIIHPQDTCYNTVYTLGSCQSTQFLGYNSFQWNNNNKYLDLIINQAR